MSMGQESAVELAYVERFERRNMSRAEFDRLPEKVRAEYVDGVALMSPPSTGGHNATGLNVAVALRAALPGTFITYERGVELPTGALRIPDLAVQHHGSDDQWSPEVPVLVVEILSPSTRDEDLFRKTDDYLRSGIAHYWIVDRSARTLIVLVNVGDRWEVGLSLSDDDPTGTIEVADLGSVELDLTALLA